MTARHWLTQVSADFNTTGDWTGGVVPGSGDDAILDASGASLYTVSTSTSESVHSIQTAATATLSINSGTFTASAGTGSGANAGTINVGNNTSFVVGGAINNTGTININSSGNTTSLVINAALVTVSGGGKIKLTDNGQNRIVGGVSGATLELSNNEVTGSGLVGTGLFIVLDASGALKGLGALNPLIVNSPGVTNNGIIKASGAAGLTIQSTTVTSGTGAFKGNSGSFVSLQSADCVGGTMKSGPSGQIQTVDRGSLFDGAGSHPVTITGKVAVLNNTSLNIQGAIDITSAGGITGSLVLQSSGNFTDLSVTAQNATITGGNVVLSDNGQNAITGTISGPRGAQTVSRLTNISNISGGGSIGGSLILVNAATATIDATATNALIVSTGGDQVPNVLITGSNTVTNSGVLESTNPNRALSEGGLVLRSVVIANGTTGVIEANGLHTHVDLQSATIQGGALISQTTGVIDTVDGGSLLDGTANTVNNQASIQINNNTGLSIQGTITNTGSTVGSINLQSGGNATFLEVTTKNATIVGGTVNLSNNGQNEIIGTLSGALNHQTISTLDNKSTIAGGGSIGANLTVRNDGVIDATTAAGLTVSTGAGSVAGSSVLTNNGTLESTNPSSLGSLGGLSLTGGTILNTASGVIEANGLNTHVDLRSVTIQGGVLNTPNGGVMDTVDTGSILDGTTAAGVVTNDGTITLNNNTALTLQGTISNAASGVINLASGGNLTTLWIDSTGATLQGGGQLSSTDNGQNIIEGRTIGSTLENKDNILNLTGHLGSGQLTLLNDASGVINAVGGNGLVINTGSNYATSTGTVTNAGLIEASGSGGLTIQDTFVNNTAGQLLANDGSSISLQSATIDGGTLAGPGSGFFQTVDAGSLLDGQTSAILNQAVVNINNNTTLTIQGTITNESNGIISMLSGGNATDLVIDTTNATLNGGGALQMSNNGQNRIYGATASSVFDNVNNTITGSGQIGAGQLTLDNGGIIDGTNATALTLDTGANTITNTGTIQADLGGTTVINSAVNNTGLVEANGGTMQINGAISGSGAYKITGGLMQFTGANVTATITFTTASGQLLMNNSQSSHLTVKGFTTTTGTSFDFRDIPFTGSTNAVYNSGAGTLTVSDHAGHTVVVTLVGSYSGSTFTTANDGSGGTFVQDPPATAAHGAPAFVAAMAALGGRGAAAPLAHASAMNLRHLEVAAPHARLA
ncbi:MAG TPA: hypothetical protein VGS12_03745 [Caulobacteraceae bacterium]|nr:hypothetical protein [Caulobacteraceae bacterium]